MLDFKDFEFAGRRLSDFESMICCFTENDPIQTVDGGNQLELGTVKLNSKRWATTSSANNNNYSAPITRDFEICKIPCLTDNDFYSQSEVNKILRWLNTPYFQNFTPIYEDTCEMKQVVYHSSFNIQPIKLQQGIVGFALHMTTDAPFCFYPEQKINPVIKNKQFLVVDTSDEVGRIYPKIELIVAYDGTCKIGIKGTTLSTIKNCKAGEKITIDGEKGIILGHEGIAKDFNFLYPAISNEPYNTRKNNMFWGEDYRLNYFEVDNVMDVTLSYEPICKYSFI